MDKRIYSVTHRVTHTQLPWQDWYLLFFLLNLYSFMGGSGLQGQRADRKGNEWDRDMFERHKE